MVDEILVVLFVLIVEKGKEGECPVKGDVQIKHSDPRIT